MGGSSQSMLLSFNMPPVAKSGMLGFLSGGGGGFSPDDVDDLGAWYDSSDSSTITESSGRVSQWNDKKGSANLVQGTSGSQPLVVENDLNNLNVIDFVNDRDMDTGTLTGISQPQTWYFVMTAPAATGTTRRPMLSGSQQMFTSASSNRFSIYAGQQLDFTKSLGTTQFYIWTLRFNGTNSDLLLDDSSEVNGDGGTDGAGTLNIAGAFDNYANNKVAEILRYDSNVSDDDNDLIITYLQDKWDL
tara:strand:+ start:230 stop:964 length:735 start_codon:yes stop_codon:yes gene_type:complete